MTSHNRLCEERASERRGTLEVPKVFAGNEIATPAPAVLAMTGGYVIRRRERDAVDIARSGVVAGL
jgi:hypothetical protein